MLWDIGPLRFQIGNVSDHISLGHTKLWNVEGSNPGNYDSNVHRLNYQLNLDQLYTMPLRYALGNL